MGNAQSNQGQGPAGHIPSSGSNASRSGPSSPATAHDTKPERRIPIRKDSLPVPIRASPSIHDNGYLTHADNAVSHGMLSTSAITATEKLRDITGGAAISTSHIETSPLHAPEKVASIPIEAAPRQEEKKNPVFTNSVFESASIPVPVVDKNALRRRASFGSATTVDTVDDDELNIDDSRAIPTTIVWPHEGRKVYVTGTFSGWKKKFKLTPSNGQFSTSVPLPPGTHHLKFLVDGQMRTSDAIPTAVDAAGILVNYIEVNADEMPPLARQFSRASIHPESGGVPSGLPEGARAGSFDFGSSQPPRKYTSEIPSFLEDLEERQERYGRDFSSMVPPPPSLPMILSKVILNVNSSMKDDSSVLGIPNHVVLNHLATSSIKNHVLAISATTRYKKKYVSTILYKSTSTSDAE